MRARHKHKKIMAAMTLGSLLVSFGLFCQISFFSPTPAVAATITTDNISVVDNNVDNNCEDTNRPTAENSVPNAPSHNKNANGSWPCCYQNSAANQLSQAEQNFSERLTAYPLPPNFFLAQYPNLFFNFFSHDPPLAAFEQLETMVKRE